MRFENHLINEGFNSILSNFFNKMANTNLRQIEYQLKVNWYDFVDRVRENGNEDEMVRFINQAFHQNLKSLDDVNLSRLRLVEKPVKEIYVPIVPPSRVLTAQEVAKMYKLIGQGDPVMIGIMTLLVITLLLIVLRIVGPWISDAIDFIKSIFKWGQED